MTPFGKVMREHLLTRYAPKQQLYVGGFGGQEGQNPHEITSGGEIKPDAPAAQAPAQGAPGAPSAIVGAVGDVANSSAGTGAAEAPPSNPYAGMSQNDAFTASMNDAHAYQRRLIEETQADLLTRVKSGQLVPGTPEYRENVEYLANIPGGVATRGQELQRLAALGLSL